MITSPWRRSSSAAGCSAMAAGWRSRRTSSNDALDAGVGAHPCSGSRACSRPSRSRSSRSWIASSRWPPDRPRRCATRPAPWSSARAMRPARASRACRAWQARAARPRPAADRAAGLRRGPGVPSGAVFGRRPRPRFARSSTSWFRRRNRGPLGRRSARRRDDVFAGVALGQETREAIRAWASERPAADLDEAIRWLVDPAPGRAIRGRSWPGRPAGTPAGSARLLQRPDLTPLHLVRLLRLGGLLQEAPHEMLKGNLDLDGPTRAFRAPLRRLSRLAPAAAGPARAGGRLPRLGARARPHRPGAIPDRLASSVRMGRRGDLALLRGTARLARSGARSSAEGDIRLERRHALGPPTVDARHWRSSPPSPSRRHGSSPASGSSRWERRRPTGPWPRRAWRSSQDCTERVFKALAGGKAQNRTAAAEWLGRLEARGCGRGPSQRRSSPRSPPR